MKKLFLFALVALVGSTFTSCKKDYTCTCTTTDNGVVVATTSVTINAKKSDAEKSCSGNATVSGGGTTATISCKL